MSANSITTEAATVVLTVALASAWAMIRAGHRWYAWLDTFERTPSALWRAQRHVVSMGAALEVGVERFAGRLGVLDTVLDRVARVG
ncbi:hypothetical protein [Bradyrhizobium sp. USDA 4502]